MVNLGVLRAFRKLATKETDRKVAEIVEPVRAQIQETGKTARRQRDLLRLDGVTMQIYIAKGGDKK